uniref:Uncharacterized protein n=1 Tax=Leersia perrieri TaxID=77586 RepID=A0A0D9WXP0_9ORYZ
MAVRGGRPRAVGSGGGGPGRHGSGLPNPSRRRCSPPLTLPSHAAATSPLALSLVRRERQRHRRLEAATTVAAGRDLRPAKTVHDGGEDEISSAQPESAKLNNREPTYCARGRVLDDLTYNSTFCYSIGRA